MKKYGPYIIILLAVLSLLYFKTQSGGNLVKGKVTENADVVSADEGFSRNPENIIYTKHARCRMECRHITEEEVKEILQTGNINENKVEQNEKGTSYPLDGRTKADKMVRIVVAPKKKDLVIVTVIDLDTDWPCAVCK